jgi:hypothetical protein
LKNLSNLAFFAVVVTLLTIVVLTAGGPNEVLDKVRGILIVDKPPTYDIIRLPVETATPPPIIAGETPSPCGAFAYYDSALGCIPVNGLGEPDAASLDDFKFCYSAYFRNQYEAEMIGPQAAQLR